MRDCTFVAAKTGSEVLAGVVTIEPLGEHDGRSGARLDRVRFGDGTRLIVKRFDARRDLVMAATGDAVGREVALWREGALDGFPAGVSHPIVAGWVEAEGAVLVMRDLGNAVVSWDRRLSRKDCNRVFAAMIAVHHFALTRPRPGSVCSLETRVGLLSPQRITRFVGWDNPVPAAVLTGWERFHDLVPVDVSDAVRSIHEQPTRLVHALGERSCTLLHGDLFPVNIALDAAQVSFFDWSLATWGPSWLDAATFLMGAMSNAAASHDELISDFRKLSGAEHDETAMRLSLLHTLCDLGWNKALDTTDHPKAEKRARERSELEWWTGQARQILDAGVIDKN